MLTPKNGKKRPKNKAGIKMARLGTPFCNDGKIRKRKHQKGVRFAIHLTGTWKKRLVTLKLWGNNKKSHENGGGGNKTIAGGWGKTGRIKKNVFMKS